MKMTEEQSEIGKQLDSVAETLKFASEYGLECEVILFALLAMKDNPLLSIDEALIIGESEWIK